MTVVERFWARVLPNSGCLIWTGTKSTKGYGRFVVNGKAVQAHRFAWEQEYGSVPEGLQLDHLCRNRACVRPAHLEPVTNAENVRRGVAVRPRCVNGHLRIPENLRVRVSNGWMECRPCIRDRRSAYYRRHKTRLNARRRELERQSLVRLREKVRS